MLAVARPNAAVPATLAGVAAPGWSSWAMVARADRRELQAPSPFAGAREAAGQGKP